VRSVAPACFGLRVLSRDGHGLATHDLVAGRLTLRSLVTGKEITRRCHPRLLLCMAFSPDGRFLAAGTSRGRVALWSCESLRLQLLFTGHREAVSTVAFAPDGRWLASASLDGLVKVWDRVTGQEKATLEGHQKAVRALAFSPCGHMLATGSSDRTVKLWNLAALK
jgi:WD40 repeat protein